MNHVVSAAVAGDSGGSCEQRQVGAVKADHEEVLAMAAAAVKPRFTALLRGILRELAAGG